MQAAVAGTRGQRTGAERRDRRGRDLAREHAAAEGRVVRRLDVGENVPRLRLVGLGVRERAVHALLDADRHLLLVQRRLALRLARRVERRPLPLRNQPQRWHALLTPYSP